MLKSQISPIFHLTTDIIVNIILVTIKKGVYPMREDIKNEFDSEEEAKMKSGGAIATVKIEWKE